MGIYTAGNLSNTHRQFFHPAVPLLGERRECFTRFPNKILDADGAKWHYGLRCSLLNGRHGKAIPARCQAKSKVTPDPKDLWSRIQEALGVQTAPEIARKLGLTKQSVYDWQKGKSPALDTLTAIAKSGNASLHWLITGEGPKTVSQKNGSSHPHRADVPLESGSKSSAEEGVLVAHMQLIEAQNTRVIEQNDRIISLLEKLVEKDK